MPLSISQLVVPMTEGEARQELLTIAASIGLKTTSWIAGSWTLSVVDLVAPFLANLSVSAATITRGGFGDLLASDDWADLWSYSRFNVVRTPASAAVGVVTFTNTSASIYTKAAGEVVIAHTTTGKTYKNTGAVVIPASGSIANVPVQAFELGTASNAAPGAVTTMVSTLTGVTVTNPAALYGVDKETTATLIPRARTKLDALSPLGAKDIYAYIATTRALPDGTVITATSAPITRTRTVASVSDGTVSLVLATATGAPIAADVAIVQASIVKWAEPWCVQATAVAAAEVVVPVTYTVNMRGSSLLADVIKSNIATALLNYFASLPLGGEVISPDTGAVYTRSLEQAISPVNPGTVRVDVSGSNTAMSALQVARLGAITGTVVFL